MTDPEVGAAVYALMVLIDNQVELTRPGSTVRVDLGWNQANLLRNRLDWACEELGVYGPGPDPADLEAVEETDEPALPKPPRWALPAARRG